MSGHNIEFWTRDLRSSCSVIPDRNLPNMMQSWHQGVGKSQVLKAAASEAGAGQAGKGFPVSCEDLCLFLFMKTSKRRVEHVDTVNILSEYSPNSMINENHSQWYLEGFFMSVS